MIVDTEMIENLQASITKAQVFVEVESEKLAEEIVAKHNLKHTIELEQMEYAIPLFTADNAVEVKVHDLPPRMPNDLIVKQLLGYGEVLSIKNGVWKEYFPGKANGIRIFRMKIRKPIPSYITVEGETAYVMYRNQIRTCKHCTRELHIGKTCSEACKQVVSNVNGRLIAAQVLSGVSPSTVPQTQSTTSSTPPPSIVQTNKTKTLTEKQKQGPIVNLPRNQVATSSISSHNRSSSLPRLRRGEDLQAAGPSKNNPAKHEHHKDFRMEVPPLSLNYEISDEEMKSRNEHTSKRPGSPKLAEDSDVLIKRKHKSKQSSVK